MSALATAAKAITERLKDLQERPATLTVGDLIHRRMEVYEGRDGALVQRLATWLILLGEFQVAAVDRDVVHAARAELQQLPALAFKGKDHEGRPVFKTKGHAAKSPATINRYMAALSGVFTWAIEERLTPRGWLNPCRGLKRLREPKGRVRFLDAAERERLFAACRASQYPRMYAMVLTAMTSGARLGELLALKWGSVDLDAGAAYLSRSKNGDRGALVLLPPAAEALRPFVGDASRYVFGSVASCYKKPASIDTAWRHAIARAQLEDFRFHDLRHCCASYLAQAGKPLNVIQDVLRHRKIDMTLRYAHLTLTTKANAMQDALGGIGK